MEEREAYKKSVERLERILSFKADLESTYGREGASTIKCSFDLMKKHLDDVLDEKKVQVQKKEIEMVRKTVKLLMEVVVMQPIRPLVRDLTLEMSLLAFNWNRMIGRVKEIEVNALALRRLVEGHLTLVDAIGVAKRLIREMRRSAGFKPPAFELSKAYLQTLTEKRATNLSEGCTSHGIDKG